MVNYKVLKLKSLVNGNKHDYIIYRLVYCLTIYSLKLRFYPVQNEFPNHRFPTR